MKVEYFLMRRIMKVSKATRRSPGFVKIAIPDDMFEDFLAMQMEGLVVEPALIGPMISYEINSKSKYGKILIKNRRKNAKSKIR